MNRRNFVIMSFSAIALSALPTSILAKDYRALKPEAWTAHTVDDAVKAMYGDIMLIDSGVSIKAPAVAANGGAIPVKVTSNIQAKSVAIFQNANPEAAVVVFKTNKHSIIDFDIKMKMKGDGVITAIIEASDGKFYRAQKAIGVKLGGCEG